MKLEVIVQIWGKRLLRGPFLKTFQQPLAKKDEDYYLERLGNEDEEEKQEAKQILIERNLRLVAHIAKNTRARK